MIRRLRRRSLQAAQRAMPLLALAGFLAGTVGVPLPRVAHRGKDRSQPYPCMDHACGCASAEQCWRSCCCFTNRQKVAWAQRQGVTLPAYVVSAAEREPVAAVKTCCAAQAACCEHDAACCDHEQQTQSENAATIDFVLAIQARQCQGQAELLLASGAVSLPPARMVVVQAVADCGAASADLPPLCGISTPPEAPPPRV